MSDKKILATVHGRTISEEDVVNFISRLDRQTAARFQSEAGQKQLLEELVRQELMLLDALNKGYDKDADFIFEMEKVKDSLLKQYAVGKALSGISVTDEELKAYYNENNEDYVGQEEINALHILVPTIEEAEKVCQEIKSGKEFAEAAKEYSSCPSSEKGGDLGWFGKGMMVPEFESAAFALELNGISEPVKTQFGWHVIKLNGKKSADTMEFDQVKDEITKNLQAEKQEKVYMDYINKLASEYEVKYN